MPPASILASPVLTRSLPFQHFTDWDDLSTQLALASFRGLMPKVRMVNLPGSDIYGRKYGGPAAPAEMSQVVAGQDAHIARLVGVYKQSGIFDQTLFVITADHGMVSNSHFVDSKHTRAGVQRVGARYSFHMGGSGKYVYLVDDAHSKTNSPKNAGPFAPPQLYEVSA